MGTPGRLLTALIAFATLGAAGCAADIGDGDEGELDNSFLQTDNGIFIENGLNLPNGSVLPNGIPLGNGLNLGNGIDSTNGMNLGNGLPLGNGITGPFYAPPSGSSLEKWIDVDPPMRKRILRYLVECALPRGVPVQLRYRGVLETLGYGVANLGPSLQKGLMPSAEQEWVSACLLARVNGKGQYVRIDLFGDAPSLNQADQSDAAYAYREAAFYGNLFASTPRAYACVDESVGSCGRSCKKTTSGCNCGLISFATSPCTYDIIVTDGTSFWSAPRCGVWVTGGVAKAYFRGCYAVTAWGRATSSFWPRAITTYLTAL